MARRVRVRSDGSLYRSDNGGVSWDVVLTTPPPVYVHMPFLGFPQLTYGPEIEGRRKVFLVTAAEDRITFPSSLRGTLYRSGDGGLTWQELELPEDVSPTALALSPNFARDGLLFVGTADGRVLTLEDSALTGQATGP